MKAVLHRDGTVTLEGQNGSVDSNYIVGRWKKLESAYHYKGVDGLAGVMDTKEKLRTYIVNNTTPQYKGI